MVKAIAAKEKLITIQSHTTQCISSGKQQTTISSLNEVE